MHDKQSRHHADENQNQCGGFVDESSLRASSDVIDQIDRINRKAYQRLLSRRFSEPSHRVY